MWRPCFGLAYSRDVPVAHSSESTGRHDADEFASRLVLPPPPTDRDIDGFCLAPVLDSATWCENCHDHARVLAHPPTAVVAVSLYHRDTELRE